MKPFQLLMRARSGLASGAPMMKATRGAFARPDPKPYGLYKYTRRYHLEDINTVLYSDFAPEFYLHLHSIWVAHSRQGLALCFAYIGLIVFPVWALLTYLQTLAGGGMYPSLRAGEHDHMMPKLLNHLHNNNCEQSADFLGRKPATFYRNYCRQERQACWAFERMRDHGFTV